MVRFPIGYSFSPKPASDSNASCWASCRHILRNPRKTLLPQKLDELLNERWLPAMNDICRVAGFSEQQTDDLTNDVIDYFVGSPRDL
jgi:hypothetical protein